MNWLMPEPASDVRAQIAALLDSGHPKAAVFVSPWNVADLPDVPFSMKLIRSEGVLVTENPEMSRIFAEVEIDDDKMARILGYPESKTAAMGACPAGVLRVVQARDRQGSVITEALCSPLWLERTEAALAPHGDLVVMTPAQVVFRRVALRTEEAG
jgi:hypothetical protein